MAKDLSALVQNLASRLKEIDSVEAPMLEAKWILQSGMLDIEEILARRKRREPLSKILQSRGFWAYDFKVTKDTLDPRADSETLIDAVLRHFPEKEAPLKVLDLGTGTGCLLLTVLKEYPQAFGVGTDKSLDALKVALENAVSLEVSSRSFFTLCDWFEKDWVQRLEYLEIPFGLSEGKAAKEADFVSSEKAESSKVTAADLKNESVFSNGQDSSCQKSVLISGEGTFFPADIIISNPPYIPTRDIEGLQEEVRDYDPLLALDGGKDGLACYRRLAETVRPLLKTSGRIFFEIGQGQEEQVASLMRQNGFALEAAYKDLGGITRCLVFRLAW